MYFYRGILAMTPTSLYGMQRNKGTSLVMICTLINMKQFTVARNPISAAKWTGLYVSKPS